MLKHKHTFEYEVAQSSVEGVIPHKVTITLDGEITLSKMLEMFERYLQAVGYYLPENSELDFVPRS